MSDIEDDVKKQKQRADELLKAVTLMHEQMSGHTQYQEACAVCGALWRAH